MRSPPFRRPLVIILAAALFAACSAGGGYQRGIFTGFVVDTPEEDIVSKFGKPERVDAAGTDARKWVYKRKTFDPDNQNKVDEETVIVMKKDPATGKWKGAEVVFG